MKKLILAAAALAIGTSIVTAQDTNVYSRNAVGYIRTTLQSNKLYLISNPFSNMGANDNVISNMFAVVPNNTVISEWNEASQTYISYSKSARGAWSANATSRLTRAKAVFLRMPAASTGELYFMGEVPDAITAPTTTQSRAAGVTMLGFPYPVEVSFTSTPMAVSMPNSSSASIWDPAAGAYVSYSKSARGAWDPVAQTSIVRAAQGFVLRTATTGTWSTVKPYTWP